MPHVERFSVPYVDVRSLISATPEFYEYPCCDRDPLPYWTWGRVTLLGDAAHPMYPVGSNGASQAILDARALADELARAEHPRQALVAYEKKRLGSGCCARRPAPPPRPASAPSCCGSPRTDRRAAASATPRTAPSRSDRIC